MIEGYYNPRKRILYSYDTNEQIRAIEDDEEHDWIVKNCLYNSVHVGVGDAVDAEQ